MGMFLVSMVVKMGYQSFLQGVNMCHLGAEFMCTPENQVLLLPGIQTDGNSSLTNSLWQRAECV
jgi:hypothetical protein